MSVPFVSVVVPAYNEEKYIDRCLTALYEQDYGRENFEVIVVDNNSSDTTSEIIKKYLDFKYLFKEKGPVGAVRNLGAQNASGDILAFIDADCVAPADWLSKGVRLVSANPGRIFGGKYKFDGKGAWIERAWLLPSIENSKYEKDLLGGCIFINKMDFFSVSGFNERLTAGEDSRLSDDLRNNGIRTIIKTEIDVVHLGNPKDILTFTKRQVWHSENYIENIDKYIFDPTFLISLAFLLSVSIFVFSIFVGNLNVSVCSLLVAFLLPVVLSLKRISRSDYKRIELLDVPGIYALDAFYLIGRMIGILKGVRGLASKKLFSGAS